MKSDLCYIFYVCLFNFGILEYLLVLLLTSTYCSSVKRFVLMSLIVFQILQYPVLQVWLTIYGIHLMQRIRLLVCQWTSKWEVVCGMSVVVILGLCRRIVQALIYRKNQKIDNIFIIYHPVIRKDSIVATSCDSNFAFYLTLFYKIVLYVCMYVAAII